MKLGLGAQGVFMRFMDTTCHLMTMCVFRCSSNNNAWNVNRDRKEEQKGVNNILRLFNIP